MSFLLASCVLASLVPILGAQQFAVVRPFSTRQDAMGMVAAMRRTDSCATPASSSIHTIDLWLYYSGNLSDSPEAAAAVSSIEQAHTDGTGELACYREVKVVEMFLPADIDVYDLRGASYNPRWVSGPNAMFRGILSTFLADAKYEAFFLMELDSIPQRAGWIDYFIAEASGLPAAIRGSGYRGDKWDTFLSQLQDALLMHVNGNAIYNLTHPLLAWVNDQLAADTPAKQHGVAYDVRIAELILEARDGTTYPGVWESMVGKGENPYRADSKLIGNYANTLFNASFDSGAYIMHLAPSNIFTEMPSTDIVLAVADYSDGNYLVFEESLRSRHPFEDVLVMTTDASQGGATSRVGGARVQRTPLRRTPTHLALCTAANITTKPFFVFADTYHVLSSPVSVLMDGSKPVLPYLHASSHYCSEDTRCTGQLRQAEVLFGRRLAEHYNTMDTVFVTSLARDFCADWTAAAGTDFQACDPHFGPTADDYMAWIANSGRSISDYYIPVNREIKGFRPFVVLRFAPVQDPRACATNSSQEFMQTLGNLSTCTSYLEQPGQCDADASCMWRPMFQSGMCIPDSSIVPYVRPLATPLPPPATIGTILFALNQSYVTAEKVGEAIGKINRALRAMENRSTAAGRASSEVRVEYTQTSEMYLPAPPSKNDAAKFLAAARAGSCGSQPRSKCDVQEANATTGLKAEEGSVLERPATRRLQQGGYSLRFVIFQLISGTADMLTTHRVDSPEFRRAFHSALQTQNLDSMPIPSNGTAHLISFAPAETSALVRVAVVLPDASAVDHMVAQGELVNGTAIVQQLDLAIASDVLAGPVVTDPCGGRTCGGNGVCSAGICQCSGGWSGYSCTIPTATETTSAPPTPSPSAPSGVLSTTASPVLIGGLNATRPTTPVPVAYTTPPLPRESSGNSAAIAVVVSVCCLIFLVGPAVAGGALYFHGKKPLQKKNGDTDANVESNGTATGAQNLPEEGSVWV